MSFKEKVATDNHAVFLNLEHFAELHTVEYDGETYTDIPLVLRGVKESERRQLAADHAQGLYLASTVMHGDVRDLGGNIPEKGMRIKISDGNFMREYYVAVSDCQMGMLRVELEAIDE
jgi:hypothetical protein